MFKAQTADFYKGEKYRFIVCITFKQIEELVELFNMFIDLQFLQMYNILVSF